MKRNILTTLTLLMLMIAPLLLTAQTATPPPDPGSGYTDGDPDATPIPFDGGLTLLIAGGLVYGLKKSREKNSNKA